MANPSKQFEMIRLYPRLSSDPITGKAGEIYYNTATKELRLCTDSAPTWVSVGASDSAFQDRNTILSGGGIWSNNPDGLGANLLSFDADAYLEIAGLPKSSNKIEAGSITLADGEVAYVDINRIATPSTLTVNISTLDLVATNSNRIIIARNIGGIIIINDRFSLISESFGSLDKLITSIDTQNSSLSMIGGGIWSLSGSSLSHTQDAYVLAAGLAKDSNTLSASSYTLNSGEFLIASLYRSGTSNALITSIVSVPYTPDLDSFIIAYNDGSKVWLANGESLVSGESKQAGESLSAELLASLGATDWKDKSSQLRLLANSTPSEITLLTPINKTAVDGTSRSLSINGLDVTFDGVRIDWDAGKIYDYATGLVELSSFTLPSTQITDGAQRWYAVSLVAGAADIDNRLPLTVVITAAASDSSTLKATYASNSIQIGQVLLQNTSGTIQPIAQSDIVQNTIGAGASGANVNLSNLETTAINQDLLPDLTNSKDLGSELLAFADTYSYAIRTNAITTITGLDSITVGNPLAMASNGISDLADPTLAQDAATKAYVDTTANAKVEDQIVDGVTTKAPSQNAVFDALGLKVAKAGDTMTGSLSVNAGTGYFSELSIYGLNAQNSGYTSSTYNDQGIIINNIAPIAQSNNITATQIQMVSPNVEFTIDSQADRKLEFIDKVQNRRMLFNQGQLELSIVDLSIPFMPTITGAIIPTQDYHAATKKYVDDTANAVADAKVEDQIVNGVTTKAPSQNAVYDALMLKLNLSGGTMSGALSMGTTNKITDLATPTASADAANKSYVDTTANAKVADAINDGTTTIAPSQNAVYDALALKLNLSGGTMSGALNMGTTNKITNLAAPTASADAATKQYVDDGLALKLNLSGGTMTGNIVMGTNSITGGASDPFVIQQSYTATSQYVTDPAASYIGQNFTASSSYTLTKFAFKLYKTQSNTTGTIRGHLYSVVGNLPNTLLASSAVIDVSTFGLTSANAADVEFTLTSPVSLTSGVKYAIVWQQLGTTNGSVGYGYANPSSYPNGDVVYNFGSWSWTGLDLYFKTYSGTGGSSGASISFATAGALTLNSALIKGVAAGVDSTDAVNKSQLETAAGVTATVNGVNNQSSAANVTGLLFTSSGKALVEVVVNATSSLYEVFDILVVKKGATYAIDYLAHGDASGVDFTITSGGQVQYTSMNYTGFSSMTIKHKFTQI